MTTAEVWEVPEDSTISAVANRIIREENRKPPNIFNYKADSAQRGRDNAGRVSHEKAIARRRARGG